MNAPHKMPFPLLQDKQPVTVILGGCAVPPGRVLEVSGSVRADKTVQAVRGNRARVRAFPHPARALSLTLATPTRLHLCALPLVCHHRPQRQL